MITRRALVHSLGASALFAALGLPRIARGIDLISSSLATTGGALGIVGIVLVAGGDEDKKTMGKVFIIAGFAASGVFTVSSTILNIIGLAYYADEIEALELEAAAGSGPMLDSIAVGFGLEVSEVADAVGAARAHVPVVQDTETFCEALLAQLALRTRLTPERCRPIAQMLAAERGAPGRGHEELARITGLPVPLLAGIVDRVVEDTLRAAEVPGEIKSARGVVNREAVSIVERIVDTIAEDHEQELWRWIELSAEAAKSRGVVP